MIKYMILLLFSCTIMLSGCEARLNQDPIIVQEQDIDQKIIDEFNGIYKNHYIINSSYYQILEIPARADLPSRYYYKIYYNNIIYAEGIKDFVEPQISQIGDGIVRLFMSYGSNDFTVQYFDVRNGKVSPQYTVCMDVAEYSINKNLIAYFSVDNENVPKIVIKNIFDDQFNLEFDRPSGLFLSQERITFLSDTQLYIRYQAVKGGTYMDFIQDPNMETETVEEIIEFN